MKEMLIVSDRWQYGNRYYGGKKKKSMTAAASIFAKDFDFSIVYVDMSTPWFLYPRTIRTRPGSEPPPTSLFALPFGIPELFH